MLSVDSSSRVPPAYSNWCATLNAQGRCVDAKCQKALDLDSGFALAYANWAGALAEHRPREESTGFGKWSIRRVPQNAPTIKGHVSIIRKAADAGVADLGRHCNNLRLCSGAVSYSLNE
jgi:hypothetical protein